ncbi:MAG TPA: 50S ribosomal protein L32e [Bacteroidetes bacterium]|nr:50S ribosomal protein L32e [Bacteroidota bacterium]
MAEKKVTKTDKKDESKKTVKQTQTKAKTKTQTKEKQTVKKKEGKQEKKAVETKTKAKKTQKKAPTKKVIQKKKIEDKKEEKPKEKTPEKEEEGEKKEKGKYQVKKKPKIAKEIKEKLALRKEIKNRTPEFLREEWFRYKRIPKNWRRPDGITSKMRRNFKYRPSMVSIGFRGPRDVRGLHSSGFEEVLVYNVDDLSNLDPKTQAARIGGTVGTKKRIAIEKKAKELDIRILNYM